MYEYADLQLILCCSKLPVEPNSLLQNEHSSGSTFSSLSTGDGEEPDKPSELELLTDRSGLFPSLSLLDVNQLCNFEDGGDTNCEEVKLLPLVKGFLKPSCVLLFMFTLFPSGMMSVSVSSKPIQ